jgi:hypothetical protein
MKYHLYVVMFCIMSCSTDAEDIAACRNMCAPNAVQTFAAKSQIATTPLSCVCQAKKCD